MALSSAAPILIATRPEPDNARLAAAAEARGWRVVRAPLMSIAPLDADARLDPGEALAFTSANGVRAFAAANPERNADVWCVGEQSAAVARDLGFRTVTAAGGDVASLAAAIAARPPGALLHAGGADRAGDLVAALEAKGVAARRIDLYKARAAEDLPEEALAAIDDARSGAAVWVALFSPRTARIFERLAPQAALTSLRCACLSAGVRDALADPNAWRRVAIAPEPRLEALIDAATREMGRSAL